nr:transcriptional repressor [Pedobacter sp. ASV19]
MNRQLENTLKAKQINPTAMRLLVLNFLETQSHAISLTDLEKGLAPADRVTLYRTLKTFEENGLVHSIDDGTGITKYALCKEHCHPGEHDDVHVHFFCKKCGETFCLPKTQIPEVILPVNFHSDEINIVAKGVCDQCSG